MIYSGLNDIEIARAASIPESVGYSNEGGSSGRTIRYLSFPTDSSNCLIDFSKLEFFVTLL